MLSNFFGFVSVLRLFGWHGSVDYQKYIQSKAWKKKAKRARKRAGFRCADCGRRGFEVHHTTYKRLGHERYADLVVLCPACHQKRHTRGKQ